MNESFFKSMVSFTPEIPSYFALYFLQKVKLQSLKSAPQKKDDKAVSDTLTLLSILGWMGYLIIVQG